MGGSGSDDGGGVDEGEVDGGGEVCEVEGDVDVGVVEDIGEDSDVDSGGSEDTDLFVVTEDLYENSAEIPSKQPKKIRAMIPPKMNGKTQRTEECTYDDGGGVVGVGLRRRGSWRGIRGRRWRSA